MRFLGTASDRQRLGRIPGSAPSVEGLQRKLGPFTFLKVKSFVARRATGL